VLILNQRDCNRRQLLVGHFVSDALTQNRDHRLPLRVRLRLGTAYRRATKEHCRNHCMEQTKDALFL
jgi:hypothetical protein